MTSAGHIANRTAIYGVGQLIRGLSSFVMLPIYTRYLTPADYGLVELLNVIIDLTTLLIGGRVAVGIFKYYNDAPNESERRQVLATAMALLTGANLFGALLLCVAAAPIAQLLSAPADFPSALRVFAFTLVFGSVNEIFFSYLRVRDRPIAYVSFSAFRLVLQIALNVYFIVFLEMTYWGIIWGALLSTAIVSLCFAVMMGPSIGLTLSRHYARSLVSYSLPIILASLGMYYITFGDRYFLQHFHDLDEVGVYALAYKFGFALVSLIWMPFSTYWTAQSFANAKEAGADVLFGRVFLYVNIFLLAAAAGLGVVAVDLLHIIANPSYWDAAVLIPWILAAYVCQCWTEFLRFGILQSGNTRHMAYGSLVAVVAITVLYIAWIPSDGAMGAARATFAAFALRLGYIYFAARQYFQIRLDWYKLSLLVIYYLAISVGVVSIPLAGWPGLVVKGVLILLAGGLVLFSPVIERDHRVWLLSYLRRRSHA